MSNYIIGADILGAISRYGTVTTVAPTTTTATYKPPAVPPPVTTYVAPPPPPPAYVVPKMVTAPTVTTVAPLAYTPPKVYTTPAVTPPVSSPLQTAARTLAPPPYVPPKVVATPTVTTVATPPSKRYGSLSAAAMAAKTLAPAPIKASVAEVKAAAAAAKAAETKSTVNKLESLRAAAAAKRAIAAGQKLARHKRGSRAGGKLASLGKAALSKATQVRGIEILGLSAAVYEGSTSSAFRYVEALDALATAATLAITVYDLADRVVNIDPVLYNRGYDIGDALGAIIERTDITALWENPDSSIVSNVATLQNQATTWQTQAQAALTSGAPADAPSGGGGGDFGGGIEPPVSEDTVDWGGGGAGGGGESGGFGASEAEQTAAQMAAEAEQAALSEANVDWGGGGGGGGGGEIPDEAPPEEYPAEEYVETPPEEIAEGDQVTSTVMPDLGVGIITAVNQDAQGPLYTVQWATMETQDEPAEALMLFAKAQQEQPQQDTEETMVGGNAYLVGVDVLGDMGTGDAPSLPAYNGPLPLSSSVVDKLASMFTTNPTPAPSKPPSKTWWNQPAWTGAPVKRWQGAVLAGGTTAILAGVALAAVKR